MGYFFCFLKNVHLRSSAVGNSSHQTPDQIKTMFLHQIPDHALAQYAYLIGCQRTGEALIVDPERDVDRYLELAAENGFRLTAVAETHIHADYLSGARELVERHGAIVYLSAEGGPDWQFEWAKGNPNARFLHDGDVFKVGNIELKAILSAGHSPSFSRASQRPESSPAPLSPSACPSPASVRASRSWSSLREPSSSGKTGWGEARDFFSEKILRINKPACLPIRDMSKTIHGTPDLQRRRP
jgi:hypothetical protein